MIRTTRAVLATAVPTAALALSVLLASAALAPEAVTAPEATATATPVPVPMPSASPTALPWPSSATRGSRSSTEEAAAACCAAPPATSTPVADAPGSDSTEGASADGDSPDSGSPGATPTTTPAPGTPDRLPEQQDAGGVDVGVSIDPPSAPGALSMSVDASAATLVESGSTAQRRLFLGTLPTVTVTDTRDPAERPVASGWYVLATASDFTGDAGRTIGAEHLGWTPELTGATAAGPVGAGPRVLGALDGGDGGRDDAVLLRAADDTDDTDAGASAPAAGSWSATAALLLGTELTVAAGGYRSTLTLSLFE